MTTTAEELAATHAPQKRRNTKGLRRTGRKKGELGKATLLKEAITQQSENIIISYFPEVVEEVCKQAKAGNLQAAKMLFDRIIPPRKAIEHIGGERGGGVTIKIVGMGAEEESSSTIEDAEFEEIEEAVMGDEIDKKISPTPADGELDGKA